MNPCPCGYYGSSTVKCNCKPDQIKKYIHKISRPLLDRIDIHIEVNQIKYNQIINDGKTETSEQIKKRVNYARNIQKERYKKYQITSNSELTSQLTKKFCELDAESQKMLENVFEKLKLSTRAYNRILKVARTIADIEKSTNIKKEHLAEAIQYRSLDRKYWDRGDKI